MNKKKKRVIEVALELFIEKGFAQTSIQDLIQSAEISKGTFYNYFSSKNECLIAILAYVDSEGDQKRRELARGKDKRDEEVFLKQMAVRMDMNKKHNLFVLFESVMFSKDPSLIAFMQEQHIREIQWIAKRIKEVYTPSSNQYTLDQATMLMGIIHHLMHVWKMGTDKDISLHDLIGFALNRLKPVIADQIDKQEAFFPDNWLTETMEPKSVTQLRQQLLERLDHMCKYHIDLDNHNSKLEEYLHFLKAEIGKENPRIFLLESVMLSLSEMTEEEGCQFEVRKLSQLMWEFIGEFK